MQFLSLHIHRTVCPQQLSIARIPGIPCWTFLARFPPRAPWTRAPSPRTRVSAPWSSANRPWGDRRACKPKGGGTGVGAVPTTGGRSGVGAVPYHRCGGCPYHRGGGCPYHRWAHRGGGCPYHRGGGCPYHRWAEMISRRSPVPWHFSVLPHRWGRGAGGGSRGVPPSAAQDGPHHQVPSPLGGCLPLRAVPRRARFFFH